MWDLKEFHSLHTHTHTRASWINYNDLKELHSLHAHTHASWINYNNVFHCLVDHSHFHISGFYKNIVRMFKIILNWKLLWVYILTNWGLFHAYKRDSIIFRYMELATLSKVFPHGLGKIILIFACILAFG